MNDKLKAIHLVPYLLAGLLINIGSLALFSLLTYFNPRTYTGSDGFNDGLIVLMILIPIWTIILVKQQRNRAALLGYGIMAAISILFYLTIIFDRL